MQDFSTKLTAILATAMTDCQKVENPESAEFLTKRLIADIAKDFLPKHTIEITEPDKDDGGKRNFSVKLNRLCEEFNTLVNQCEASVAQTEQYISA